MNFKKSTFSIVIIGLFINCSKPQKIFLKDHTIIETRDEIKYHEKSGFYEYEDINGNIKKVNSINVLQIKEI